MRVLVFLPIPNVWRVIYFLPLVFIRLCSGTEGHLQSPGISPFLSTSPPSQTLRVEVNHAGIKSLNHAQALQQLFSPYTQQSTLTPIPSGPAEGPAEEVIAVTGGVAKLPCDLSQPGDTPILVLFSNGLTGKPVYSIDARDVSLQSAHHWSSLQDRAHFDLSTRPNVLTIKNVEADDQAEYRCRVDFRASPTRNLRIRLTVMVPPQKIEISSTESRKQLTGDIGPFPLGTDLSLTCTVIGGRPPPRVTWWHEEALLDEVSEQVTEDISRNTLTLPNLSRQHLHRVITCRASNSNMTRSINASVKLDMTFPPVEVRIINTDKVMKEGTRYSLVCEASGSRPPVILSWWVDGVLKTDAMQQTTKDGNVSRATLQMKPSRDSDGAVVLCRAVNPEMPSLPMEDIIKLNVQYAPKLQLRAGQNLVMTNIKEGDDVYFECDIQANPKVQVVRWFLGDVELHHNVSAGIIQSNQSLVLQGVKRASSGEYVCQATNHQGTTTSSPIFLTVKFAPVCVERQKWTYGIGRRESVNVTCSVEAYPEAGSFRWAFNSTTELVHMPRNASQHDDNFSSLLYTPVTHHDFGTLLCWADNDVGRQAEPCIFLVVPAEPVQNCSVWQDSSTSGEVVIACFPGWSAGLSQMFSLHVTQQASRNDPLSSDKVVAEVRDQKEPYFTISGLKPGKEYHIAVLATNAHGSSPPTLLAHHMPIDVAEKRTSAAAAGTIGTSQAMAITPIIAVVVGVVATLIICSVVLVLAIRARLNHTAANQREQACNKKTPEKSALRSKSSDDGGFTQLKRGPDLILVKGENQEERQLMELYPRPLQNTACQSGHPATTSTSGMLTLSTTNISLPSADINPSGGTIITQQSESSMEPISSAMIHTASGGASASASTDPRGYRASSISSSAGFPHFGQGTMGRSASCSEKSGGCGGGADPLLSTIPHSTSYSSSYNASSFTLPRHTSSSTTAGTLAKQASSTALYRDFTPADLNTSRESCV
ncbi:nephrin-like isoform X2 [Palaemon carinicauda]|uniref:nephrin-like isoform X2 n=1 Tax=Palaemon carinicauda TaxID=392227 RepID=UPI0035B59CB0